MISRALFLATAFVFSTAFSRAAQPEADTSQIDVETVARFDGAVPAGLELRARVLAISPAEPAEVLWRHGGEGLGGSVVRGRFPKADAKKNEPNIDDLLDRKPAKSASAAPDPNAGKLAVGEWSGWVPIADIVGRKAPELLFLTVTAGRRSQFVANAPANGPRYTGHSTGLEMEFELRLSGKSLKTFRSEGKDGCTVGLVLPFRLLAGGKTPADKAFVEQCGSLLDYAARRQAYVKALPFAGAPMPKRYQMLTAMNGYGEGAYHGLRYSSRAVAETEARTLRLMGINGFQGGPSFLHEHRAAGQGLGMEFAVGGETNIPGYPTPRQEEGRAPIPEAGCPYAPGVPERQRAGIEGALAMARESHLEHFWGITEDEIGTVFDRSPEGKAHLLTCPQCRAGFHAYLESEGLKPADFGDSDWSGIAPVDVFTKRDAKSPTPEWMTSKKAAMLAYWTRRFNCHASAQLFSPLRDALHAANAEKRAALARGETDTPAAKQPWMRGGAMRGNTFLMGGHSLDFFDFYRLADNHFVYETSNRDARVWQWDSYLCDVGRVVSGRMDKSFGILVKPHRGAPVQRALSAIGRGVTMINWYTYGPDYAKGDSFSQDDEDIALVGKANALIAQAEDITYGSQWVHRPEVAIVNPRASEIWMGLTGNAPAWTAAWENAKWMYTALTHAHVPVDAIDATMVRDDDLSGYRVIYVNGPNFEKAATAKLLEWVSNGGTLVTCGHGLARDEYNEPLADVTGAMGLKSRTEPEMYRTLSLYGATTLDNFMDAKKQIAAPPAGAMVVREGADSAGHAIQVGREKLQPVEGTEILAHWVDGGAAMTRHRHGKGEIVTIGFFPGLEYIARATGETFDLSKDLNPAMLDYAAGPVLAKVRPVVSADAPTIEGLFVRHPETGKRAVLLMNWTYRTGKKHVPMTDLRIQVRWGGKPSGLGELPKSVKALALKQELGIAAQEDIFEVRLPRIEEGEILILE